MAIAINIFKTVTANVTTSGNVVYSAPSGYSSVVLLAQVSNTGNSTVTVSANHVRSGNYTNILTNGELPPNDSMNLLLGKLILQTGDGFSISASDNNAAELLLSVLETANP
jgi:hypothetical protein